MTNVVERLSAWVAHIQRGVSDSAGRAVIDAKDEILDPRARVAELEAENAILRGRVDLQRYAIDHLRSRHRSASGDDLADVGVYGHHSLSGDEPTVKKQRSSKCE